MPAELPELAYQLALRSLDQQQAGLDELRSRTNTLLAAAAVSASFLRGPPIDRGGVSVSLLLAAVAFAATLGLCLFVLIPTSVTFALDGTRVYETLYEHEDDRDPTPARLLAAKASTPITHRRSSNAAPAP